MRSISYYAFGFGFVGLFIGGAFGEVLGGKPWQIFAIMLWSASSAATFGAIVGLSKAVEDLSDVVSELGDRLDSNPSERHWPSRLGDAILPRFEEESATERPFPTDDQIGPHQEAP